MSGLHFLMLGMIGQWLLGVGAASWLLVPRGAKSTGMKLELTGLGLVLGIGLNAWLLFIWSLAGFSLGPAVSFGLSALGAAIGLPVVWQWRRESPPFAEHRKHSISRTMGSISDDSQNEQAWCRLCQVIVIGLLMTAFWQTLMTPHHFWDERAIFAIKGLVLDMDHSIHSRDLADPDFVQYHPRYPLLIPLAEQHIYAMLGRIDDRWAKLIFPALYAGLILTMTGVLFRYLPPGNAWLCGLLVATIPVLMPHELGFLSGQADAPMACYHGIAVLYLWHALLIRCDSQTTSKTDRESPPLDITATTSARTETNAGRLIQPGTASADQTIAWWRAALVGSACGGLAAFVKDEGIGFLIADGIAMLMLATCCGWNRKIEALRILKALGICVAGAALLLGPWFLHRRVLPATTEMSYFERASISLVFERLSVLNWQCQHILYRMFAEGRHWGLHWWLMGFLAITLRRPWRSAAQWLLLLDVLGSIAALMLAGMLAPAQLTEHIGGSSHRYLMQLAPISILFSAGQMRKSRLTITDETL